VRHRIAVHTGEIGVESAELHGITLDIARDVIAHAGVDEILASRTVADLVAGSGIALEDRGEVALGAIGQTWHLYRVAP